MPIAPAALEETFLARFCSAEAVRGRKGRRWRAQPPVIAMRLSDLGIDLSLREALWRQVPPGVYQAFGWKPHYRLPSGHVAIVVGRVDASIWQWGASSIGLPIAMD